MATLTAPTATHTVPSIRMSDDQLNHVLDHLEKKATQQAPADHPNDPAHLYYGKDVIVTVTQGQSTATSFCARVRYIRATGLRFLHGVFIHAGTPCIVRLVTTQGARNDVAGRISDCQHLVKRIHVVQVTFDLPIKAEWYSRTAHRPRILIAEDRELVSKVASLQLAKCGADVDRARDGVQVIEKALNSPYDAILMDMKMPTMDGFAATAQLREKGYAGLIVAATALPREADRQRCFDVGCDRFIAKPYSRETLAALIDDLRVEPLSSVLSHQPDMLPLIDAFVDSLTERIESIEEAVRSDDSEALMTLVEDLKSEGAMCGFAPISDCAVAIETELLKGVSPRGLRYPVHELTKLCRGAQPASSVAVHPTDAQTTPARG